MRNPNDRFTSQCLTVAASPSPSHFPTDGSLTSAYQARCSGLGPLKREETLSKKNESAYAPITSVARATSASCNEPLGANGIVLAQVDPTYRIFHPSRLSVPYIYVPTDREDTEEDVGSTILDSLTGTQGSSGSPGYGLREWPSSVYPHGRAAFTPRPSSDAPSTDPGSPSFSVGSSPSDRSLLTPSPAPILPFPLRGPHVSRETSPFTPKSLASRPPRPRTQVKNRNGLVPADELEAAIVVAMSQSAASEGRWVCPFCGFTEERRLVDFTRHLRTHGDPRWECKGIPVRAADRESTTRTRKDARGVQFFGGCGKMICRADAYKRHLSTHPQCQGDTNGWWWRKDAQRGSASQILRLSRRS